MEQGVEGSDDDVLRCGGGRGSQPPDQLRTVYVEHDIQATLEELTVGLNLI